MKKLIALLMIIVLAFPFVSCGREKAGSTVYTITATMNGNYTIDADMTVDYYNDTDTEITSLRFNLFPVAFREGAKFPPVQPASELKAYPNGKSYGGIEIISCKEGGSAASWSVEGNDENVLAVCLKDGVFPEERREVSVKFKVTVPNAKLRLGYYGDIVNLGNWFPILCVHGDSGFYECDYSPVGDPFYSETADFHITLSVPGEYTVASGGTCVSTDVGGELTTYVYEMENFRDAAFVIGKNLNVSSTGGEIPVNYYYAECENPSAITGAAELAIETFSELFGEYPFGSLTVVSTPFVQGGMEFPGIVYISDALPIDDAIAAAVHETAHQWWYAAVGNNQWECAFLDEGLAEYSTVLFYENNPSYGITREEMMREKYDEYRAFYGVFQQLVHEVDTSMGRKLDEFSGEYEYVEIAYVKSSVMLDEFRKGVGDARFFRGLKKFYRDNKFGIASPDDLIAAFNGAGCDAEGFFRGWIDGKVVL